jgi:ABC-2 type transport system permease protein
VSLLWSELRLRRGALAVWAVAIALLILMIGAVYPSIRDNPELDSIYGSLSPSAQQLLGGSDLTSPAGYLSTQVFAFFLPAVILVFALTRAASTLAGEEEDRTLDLLLAQPLARWNAYAQKAFAVVIGIATLCLATLVPLLVLNAPVHFDLAWSQLAGVVTQMFLFCLALAMWAMALSAATGRRAVGLAVVVGYVVLSYLVYGLSSSIAWLSTVRPLSLWRWFLGNDPLQRGFGAVEIIVLAGAALVAIVLGIWAFHRRDLHA